MLKKSIKPWILALVFALPTPVGAQDAGAVDGAVAAGETGEVTTAAAEGRIDAALETAFEAGVPISLLESKIAEGQAKGVPMQRIAVAVEGRLAALMHAAETLDAARIEVHNEGELSVAVDALAAGVGENALVRVSSAAPPERRIVAIAVLTDLVRLGTASEQALMRVNSALGTNTALANLQAEVGSQLRAQALGSTLDVLGQSGIGAGANANAGVGIGNGRGAAAGAEAGVGAGGSATIPDLPDVQLPDGVLEGGATGRLGLD